MGLGDIVNVVITKESVTVAREGFGVPLVLAYHTAFADLAKSYASVDEVLDDFDTVDNVYKASVALFAQNPKPPKIIVGRRSHKSRRSVVLTVAAVKDSTLYRVTINDVNYDFTSGAGATQNAITAGITTAINAGSPDPGVGATDGMDGTVALLHDASGAPFRLGVDRHLLTQADGTADSTPSIADDLDDIRKLPGGSDEWYMVVSENKGQDEIAALAAYVESAGKTYMAGSADDAIMTSSTTDIASVLQAASYARTALVYHTRQGSFPDAAWAGRCLPLDPGSETWKFKTLAGIAADRLFTGEESTARGKNANFYSTVAGVNITAEGVTASGEFVDVTRFIDSLAADIKEHVFARLASATKIPFTDQGIGLIEAEIRGALLRGIAVGGLAASPAPVVTVPKAVDVDSLDKAARLLKNILFTAVLAGAIHKLVINGKLTV